MKLLYISAFTAQMVEWIERLSGALNSGLIPSQAEPITLKLAFKASPQNA